jgi:hypothetical protein
VDPSGHTSIPFEPVFINVNLATSGIPQNSDWNYPPAQTRYNPAFGLKRDLWNLCGDISLSMIFETETGFKNSLPWIYAMRPPSAMDTNDEGTNDEELALIAGRLRGPFSGWGVNAQTRRTDITNADGLANTLADMLRQDHYLVVGVTQDKYGPNLVNRGTDSSCLHWVVVYGVDENYVYIVNPYTNTRQKYTWEEFYQSWTYDWVELAPPPDPEHIKKHKDIEE